MSNINFLFDSFLPSGLPNHNIVPLNRHYDDLKKIPVHAGADLNSWNPIHETLTMHNSITSNYHAQFIDIKDCPENDDTNKNIYLIQLTAQDYQTMWPFYYMSRELIDLVNNDKCKVVVSIIHAWPMLSHSLSVFITLLYTAIMHSSINNLDNIVLLIDAGAVNTKILQDAIDNEFSSTDSKQNLSYISDELRNRSLRGLPKFAYATIWEQEYIKKFSLDKTDYITKYINKPDKNHSYLYLNSSLRPHRYVMYKAAEYLDIKKDSLHSFRNFDTFDNHKAMIEHNYPINCEDVEKFHNYIIENPNAEPVFLEYDAKFNATVQVNFFDALIQVEETNLINTWFSLVTETGTLSEKTFKLIYYGHPFIIVGCDHILKDLHKLGYKTFDFIFDESYDDMPMGYEKILFIGNQIKQYCGEEGRKKIAEKLPEIEAVLRHNRKLFITKDHNEFWAKL
jgi:hypothetical protein